MLRDEAAAPVSRRAARNLLQSRSIGLFPRELEPGIVAALDATTLASPLRLRVTGETETIRRGLAQGLADAGLEPAWLADWLVDDVMRLANFYREATRTGENSGASRDDRRRRLSSLSTSISSASAS